MGGAAGHTMWLLPLFVIFLVLSSVSGASYKQQVVVILDDDITIQKAGQLLYQKFDTRSHILKWNETTAMLESVKWNTDTAKFEAVEQDLPIGPGKIFSWSDTIVQVLGLGKEPSMTISGFSAAELAILITEDLASDDVGFISIISTIQPHYYLEQFMLMLDQLQRFETTISMKLAVFALDHSGDNLTGEIVLGTNSSTAMEWKHASPPDSLVGYFEGQDHSQVVVPGYNPEMQHPPSFGILPGGTKVHVTDYSLPRPLAFHITDEFAFEWIDMVADRTYKKVPHGRASSSTRLVQFLFGSREIPVISINSIHDLLKELRHYGDKGPSKKASRVYYDFRGWVVSMSEVNFNVNLEGMIVGAADPANRTAQVENILRQWQVLPEDYQRILSSTGSSFFEDVIHWINGEEDDIKVDLESAINAQCGVAIFLSESIRSFHTHVTNMMSLDLAHQGYLTKDYFFSSHPMVLEGISRVQELRSGKKGTGLDLLKDRQARAGSLPDPETQRMFEEVLLRISRVTKSWLSHVDTAVVKGSRHPPPASEEAADVTLHHVTLLSVVKDIGSTPPASPGYLRVFELDESANRLLSLNISEPEVDAIDTLLQDFLDIDYKSLPLQASIALVSDHAYISDLISKELYLKEQQTGKKYEIVPDTIEVDENTGEVEFFVRESANITSELKKIKSIFDLTKLRGAALLEKLLSLSKKTKGIASLLKKGQSITNAIRGMVGAIGELENGKILKGTFDLAKNAYKFGDVTGINKAAGEFLGKAMKHLSEDASKSVESSVANKVGGKIHEVVGEFKDLKEKFAPIIGALYNIYNIYEDFHRHTTLGYIDGAFDIATTVLSYLGPEGEVFALALSIIKMGVDIFYNSISKEIHALPPHASVAQYAWAVIKGIAESIYHIVKSILDSINIFAVFGKIHALDKEYHKDQDFLNQLKDYRTYYNIEGTNSTVIDFAGATDSWNGGDITFHLGEDGHSTLTLETVDSNGHLQQETHDIVTSTVEDIVLGIGESHTISFTKRKVKFLGITVHSRNVISKIDGQKQTLYGIYYGNSHNNKFIAVQDLPPKTEQDLKYNLEDYHYTLYGGGGNDSFYLGPQPTYIEGNEGSDTYFINSTATITEINSHSADGESDTVIINLNFAELTAIRAGLDLNLTSSDTHIVILHNWFHDVTHQRVVFKSGDGVIFKVSATITEAVELIPYGLTGSSLNHSVLYNASLPLYSEVIAIIGSKFNDVLVGNDLDNQLNGAGGDDTLTGGEGKDTYNVDLDKGVDTIDNYAVDGSVDTLVIGTDLDQLIFSSRDESSDLFIIRNESSQDQAGTGAVVKNWFMNETYRHMIVVTNDKAIVKVSSVKTPIVSYQPFIVNMSHLEEQAVERGDLYSRVLDLNSNPVYSEVTTVLGTAYNDTIIGNLKSNYITGAQGFDYIEGREGADTYIVKNGDGNKLISNCAKDTEIDTLLFGAAFLEMQLSNTSAGDLVLSDSTEQVTFLRWFRDPKCQHLLVRSVDGVTFELPNTTESLITTAKLIDFSNLTTDVDLVLTGKWEQVEQVVGSQGYNHIVGNSLDNYLDPGAGNSSLQGGNGSDTYVIHSTGGERFINNFAEDDQTDAILFSVPFLSITTEVIGPNIKLSSLSGDGLAVIYITNYDSPHSQHLVITTSDGISFVLPLINTSDVSNYKPIPMSINLAQVITGQHLDLRAYPSFSEVRSLYGSSRFQNCLIGNEQNNTLVGGDQQDNLQGLEGDDTLKGGDGDDWLYGGLGSDIILGEDGNDKLFGEEDDDIILPGTGANEVNGGTGIDTVIYSGDFSNEEGIVLNLGLKTCIHDGGMEDILNDIENAYGTDSDDTLVGDDIDNVLVGKGGNDTLIPGSGYDTLNGGNGSDVYDLTDAQGTVTIENYAADMDRDLVVMGYSNLSSLWYEIAGKDVIIRVINSQYPTFYDGHKPMVVFRSFMNGPKYQHTDIETAEGYITDLKVFISTTSSVVTPKGVSLYGTLAGMLIVLVVFIGCAVVGAYYKLRSKRRNSGSSLVQYTKL